MIQVYDTLSQMLRPFEPMQGPHVKMYVCGPTVYDHAHIGHGRAYVVYDTIVRFLRYRGFKVTYVRNITDIDNKIIHRSNEQKIPFSEFAQKYTDYFNEDLKNLGLIPPDHSPKASETIPEIISHIEGLIKKGRAYASQGDVYFSIPSWKEYGKLSRRDLKELKVGARVEPGEKKQDPLDFALWKMAKPDEPAWDSPWGKGRPGWHIECSAMVRKILGDTIDIHAGGRDLIFPHHENEIAQTEGFTEKEFSKYWFHNGFVNINAEKMSKSLGNFVTIRDLLKLFHPEALKLFLMTSHYRAPLDFTDTGVHESAKALDRVYRVLLSIPATQETSNKYLPKFEAAMDDDFNTAQALSHIFDAVKEANKLQLKQETTAQASALRNEIVKMANILGLLQDDPTHYFKHLPGRPDIDTMAVENLLAARAEARRKKDYKEGDRLRDELKTKFKVTLEDSPEGTTWRVEA